MRPSYRASAQGHHPGEGRGNAGPTDWELAARREERAID